MHALRGNVMDRSSCSGHCCRFDDPGLDSEEKALKSMANLAAELLARKDTSVIFGPVKKNAIKQVHYIAQMPAVKVRHAMRCCASMCGSSAIADRTKVAPGHGREACDRSHSSL